MIYSILMWGRSVFMTFPFTYPVPAEFQTNLQLLMGVIAIAGWAVSYISVAFLLRGIAAAAGFSIFLPYFLKQTLIVDWIWSLGFFSFFFIVFFWVLEEGYRYFITAKHIHVERLSIEEERKHQERRSIEDRRRQTIDPANRHLFVNNGWDGVDRRKGNRR